MNNQNEETKKILTGLLVGAVGAGALYCIYVATHQKTPLLKKIGRTIAQAGEMLENCDFSSVAQVAESIEQTLPAKNDVLNNLGDWVSTGISLWKKISK